MDYKEKYEAALAVAQNTYKTQPMYREWLVSIFPELKENEDEQHRKWILEYLYDGLRKSDEQFKGQFKCAIAWLEAQGEHANFISKIQVGDKVTRNKDGVLVNLSQLKRVAKPTDKVEPKFKVGDRVIGIISDIPYFITEVCDDHYNTESGCIIMFCAQDNFELYKQKPAEWGEDDERILNTVIHNLRYPGVNYYKKPIEEEVKWLKSIKDRVQPQSKKEWSKEDDAKRQTAIHFLYNYDHIADVRDCINWLESITSQTTWKPSDEQMVAIKTSINVIGKGTLTGKHLEEVLEQLKRLK